jgi:hypothetical protein
MRHEEDALYGQKNGLWREESMSAFDKAWSSLLTKGVVDAIMDAASTPALVTDEDHERRSQEIDQILEDIANQNGITTADIYRHIDLTGHPDDPNEAVYEDVSRRRQQWEEENGRKVNWPGMYVPHMGIEPDPELMRIAEEWDENYDHPGGDDHLQSLGIRNQISNAMYEISEPEFAAFHEQRMGQQ